MTLNSKHTEARFSPNATDSLCLLVIQDQVPIPRDIANHNNMTDYPLRMRMG